MKKISFRKYIVLTILAGGLILSSCATKKNLIYFQGQGDSTLASKDKNYTPVLKTDDFLYISVLGLDEDAIKPFNLPYIQTPANITYSSGTPNAQGYLIDANGDIDFPVLGKIKIAGLDRMTATALIKEKLSEYIANPIVHIRILNFKITVLGEVKNPGTFSIPNERITLPEALGLAGDLNITGIRKNVLVIRDINGKKTQYRVDLTSRDLFASPVYYLNQNDLVYVQPNKLKISSSGIINPGNAGIVVSTASLIITVLSLLTR